MTKPDSANPYLAARKEYMEQTGSLVKSREQWRIASIIEGIAIVILAGGFVAVSLQHRVVPYTVEFNEHSEVARVHRSDVMPPPNSNQIKASLRSWIIGARTVYGDLRAQETMLKGTYDMTLPGSAAYKSLNATYEENNPYARSQKELVEVAVNSVMRITDDTWRIEWTETTKAVSGQVMERKHWQGPFTVVIVPPAEEAQILVNPLGVYVKEFSWAIRQL